MSGAGYTNPLQQGGATVLPSTVTFTEYSILAGQTVQLAWPVDNFPANANVVAQLMQVIPLGGGAQMQMPSALNTSLGEKTLIANLGSLPVTVLDNTGATIVVIPSGAATYFALVNNNTIAGQWFTFQAGATTSLANAAVLAGAGLQAQGLVLNQIMSVTTLASNYAASINDRDQFFNWTSGAGTLTLPTVASVGNNWYIQLRNSGSGTLTVATQGADLINGGTTQTFNVSDSAFIVCDGTGFWTLGLGTINTNIFNFQVVSLAGQSGTYVLPANQQNKVAYRFTGALAGNTNIQVPATIQQYWVNNVTTGGFTLGIGTSAQIIGATQFNITNGASFICYCDGVNVVNASTSGLSVPIAINQGGTNATTAGAALVNLGGTSTGIAIFTATSTLSVRSQIDVISAGDSQVWGLMF